MLPEVEVAMQPSQALYAQHNDEMPVFMSFSHVGLEGLPLPFGEVLMILRGCSLAF